MLGLVMVAALAVAGCGAVSGAVDPAIERIAAGLAPRLTASDAVAMTRSYLDAQRGLVAAPELHQAPDVLSATAVRARDAADLDACIPATDSDAIVWLTFGTGDYLNLEEHPWSPSTVTAPGDGLVDGVDCFAPGPNGVLAIDDATGAILGVYPVSSRPHAGTGLPGIPGAVLRSGS